MSEIADEGVDPGAEGVPGDAPGVVDPEPALEASEPTALEPAAPGWAPSQEDWQATQATIAQIAQQLQPPPPPAPQAPQWMQTDPDTGESLIDPNQLSAYIDFQIQQGVQQRIGTYEPIMNQTIADRGEALITERLTELQSQVGAFDPNVARQIAEGLVTRGGDPFQAIKDAAALAHSYQESVKAAAIEEYKQQLANIGNAPREPGASGAGVDVRDLPVEANGKISYEAVTRDWAARHSIPT